MSFVERLHQKNELAKRDVDPLGEKVEATVREIEAVRARSRLSTCSVFQRQLATAAGSLPPCGP